MATVFNELKDEILPQLRRSQVVNTTDIQGKTDEEILACIKNGQQLTVEEYPLCRRQAGQDAGRAGCDPGHRFEEVTTTPAYTTTWVSPRPSRVT